jgi:hypothetical protein
MDNLTLNILIGILTTVAGCLIRRSAGAGNAANSIQKAEEKREAVKDEIEKTSAADLVAAAPNADELRAATAGIKNRAEERLRDKIRRILSRVDGTGDDDGDNK